MSIHPLKSRRFDIALSLMLALSCLPAMSAAPKPKAAGAPHTPQEFAQRYVAAFNKKDRVALSHLRLPSKEKSALQDLVDEMSEAEMLSGTQYTKFEITATKPGLDEPNMGPDGLFYKPSLKPTNMVKVISVTKNGTSSSSFPIGLKNGAYYQVTAVLAPGAAPAYQFGWQRFTLPKATWSVLMPNEPDPGKAALEKQFGKAASEDPDIYGVIKNTASIKTFQHFFSCGEEGKRLFDDNNKERFTASCTTYSPETLKEWLSDPAKNLSDAVDSAVRNHDGTLVGQKDIKLGDAPGKEYEAREKDGDYCKGRIYWIKDALYQLTFTSKKEKPDTASADKFLDSLEVQ